MLQQHSNTPWQSAADPVMANVTDMLAGKAVSPIPLDPIAVNALRYTAVRMRACSRPLCPVSDLRPCESARGEHSGRSRAFRFWLLEGGCETAATVHTIQTICLSATSQPRLEWTPLMVRRKSVS